jgi:hypothetical protein
MTDKPTNLRDQAASYLNSDAFKSLVPYLMSGGVGAIAGGALSGRRRADSGESRVGYLGRILRNALIAGGLAGGAHYLGAKGLEKTVGNMSDSSKVLSGAPNDEGPLSTTVKNVAFSPITAASAGLGALAATRGRSVIGAGSTDDYIKRLLPLLNKDTAWANTASADEIADAIRALPTAQQPQADQLRRMAGLPSSNVAEGSVGKLLERAGLSSEKAQSAQGALSTVRRRGLGILGQSTPRAIGRGAIGLAAAGIPAIIGALITNKTSEA